MADFAVQGGLYEGQAHEWHGRLFLPSVPPDDGTDVLAYMAYFLGSPATRHKRTHSSWR